MPPPIKLSLFYDITSPWSYIAFEALQRYKRAWNLRFDLHPMFLGAVHIASKNVPPASIPNKAKWMVGDLALLSQVYDLNLRLPPGFPFNKAYNTLNVMRFMRVLRMERPELLEDATRRLYEEFFGTNTPTNTPVFLQSLTRDPALLTPSELSALLTASQDPANKEGLKTDAERLAADPAGPDGQGQEGGEACFGFPWIVCEKPGGERCSFFGSDRMLSISQWLGKEQYPYTGVDPEARKSKL
ncbi:thioredoxin-like protein [Calocera cornea HHB12733]|uniref:Glutathione S-transferase kappa 1 n=1 Tax=Calocera cornea HHB12733 TaxID=1353952 RepID=A0A165EWT2_9BASI|nr:thioredoxin-like protein [Calocera cornea HHB12733]